MIFEMRGDILDSGSGYGFERGRGRIDGIWNTS